MANNDNNNPPSEENVKPKARILSGPRAMAKRFQDSFNSSASSLVNRLGMASMVGLAMDGKRDYYNVFGYKRVITYREAWQRYRRQDITSRIIDAPVNALWSNPPQVTSNDAAWNEIWNDLVINKGLFKVIARADKMAGLGDYAVLLIGFDKTKNVADPITKIEGRKVLYFQPYDYSSAQITNLVTDPTNARYMKPNIYRVQPALLETPKPLGLQPLPAYGIHHSRVIHIAENILADEVFGNPRIERVWNLLDDLLKVTGGTAETFWLMAYKGMQIDVDKEMELSPEDEADLTAELDEYANQLRRYIRTRGITIKDLGSDTPDCKNVFDMIMSLISGSCGIPKRILLGSEAGQLASGEDRNNWAERIGERRTNFGEPTILWPLIRQLTQAGVLPSRTGLTINIKWPDPFQSTPLEKATTNNYRGLTAANISRALVATPQLMTIEQAQGILDLDPVPTEIDSAVLEQDGDVSTTL